MTAKVEPGAGLSGAVTLKQIITVAAESKELVLERSHGVNFFRSNSLGTFHLDEETIEGLGSIGLFLEERADGLFSLTERGEDVANNAWFFKGEHKTLSLSVGFEVIERSGGVICRVFVESSLVSSLDSNMNHQLVSFLVGLRSAETDSFVLEIVEKTETKGVLLTWENIGLEGLCSFDTLFKERICPNGNYTLLTLAESQPHVFTPRPLSRGLQQRFIVASEQEELITLWRDQIKDYRRSLKPLEA